MNEFKFYRALAIINCVPLTVFTCLDNDFIIRGNFKTRLYIDRCIEVQIQRVATSIGFPLVRHSTVSMDNYLII